MAIILEKCGDKHKINLEKNTASKLGEIIINLNWSRGKGGFLSNLFSKDIDLDLGCFYELRNGMSSLIDGLQFSRNRGGGRHEQSRQGSYDFPPYIWHQGDDRGHSSFSGETIYVNPKGINAIRRIMVYTFIYDGVARWSQTNAVVTIKVPGQEDVGVPMGQVESPKKFCVIAKLDFGGDDSITVQKLVTFHNSHLDCDQAYDWGFNYAPGRKD